MSTRGDVLLDAGMKGWIFTIAKSNFWRVAYWYEFQDLIQDGYLCYAKCRARYGQFAHGGTPTKEERKWFMALVQRAYINHITDLANWKTATPETPFSMCEEETISAATVWLSPRPLASLGGLMVSDNIKRLALALISDIDTRHRKTRLRKHKTATGSVRYIPSRARMRETRNQLYCRLVGLDPVKVDLVAEVREQFI
jgi:hypothetical protein